MPRAKTEEDVFDLSALRKEAKEAETPFVLIYDGDRYELPPPKDIDIESMADWSAAIASGQASDPRSVTIGLQALLGDRYEDFKEYRITVGEAAAIFEAWANHYGLSAGES
jgi:hypothetical protein